MNNKVNVLCAQQSAEENRKQLLRDIVSNIEQLCIALSMSYPNLVEIQESKVHTAEQSTSDANIDPISLHRSQHQLSQMKRPPLIPSPSQR